APKFPPSQQLRFLMRERQVRSSPEIDSIVTLTLDKMARGGLYDQLGGGFARYSTDSHWHVPHFEKMLYDNALLVVTYLEAASVYSDRHYAEVARATLNFLVREMRDPETGAFYAALDAGEVGREGEFYGWHWEELCSVLSAAELRELERCFDISEAGNFEGLNVLRVQEGIDWNSRWESSLQKKLFERRELRDRPHRDVKILTSWNGLLLGALSLAATHLEGGCEVQGKSWGEYATELARYLTEEAFDGEELCISAISHGERKGRGCVDDYAFVISGLLTLYRTTGVTSWLFAARKLQLAQNKKLWSSEYERFRFSAAEDLFVERHPLHDGALPSGNGVSLANLDCLSKYFFDVSFREQAEKLRNSYLAIMNRLPTAVPTALMAMMEQQEGGEVVVVGKDSQQTFYGVQQLMQSKPLRFSVVGWGVAECKGTGIPLVEGKGLLNGELTYYLCQDGKGCYPPVSNIREVSDQIMGEGTDATVS
ncbi:MAG: thioredoxin domain-containing protein, partial [Bdellovibrionales bacterium]|nr:thioredoxin domain-containing protein [Bdellovibrionales bacterium]